MSDPLRKPTSGEPFVPSAKQFGMFIDAAVAARNRAGGKNGGGVLGPAYILVRNDTGSDLESDHPVVGLDDPIILPSDRETVVHEMPCFSGVTPAAGHTGKFAVLVGPLKADAIGLAVISGGTWVRVSGSDEWADIASGETGHLAASDSGSARILFLGEEDDGARWAFARLSNLSDSRIIRFTIESVYGITAEVTVDGWNCGGSNPSEYGTLTVHDAIGCLLDEEAEDLVGRQGYATRMYDQLTDSCRWEITSLCCPPEAYGGG